MGQQPSEERRGRWVGEVRGADMGIRRDLLAFPLN